MSFSYFCFCEGRRNVLFRIFTSVESRTVSCVVFLPVRAVSLTFRLLGLLKGFLPIFRVHRSFFLRHVSFTLGLYRLKVTKLVFQPRRFLFWDIRLLLFSYRFFLNLLRFFFGFQTLLTQVMVHFLAANFLYTFTLLDTAILTSYATWHYEVFAVVVPKFYHFAVRFFLVFLMAGLVRVYHTILGGGRAIYCLTRGVSIVQCRSRHTKRVFWRALGHFFSRGVRVIN